MAKKGGNKSDDFNPFGELFDFDKNGKTDFGEMWIAYNIYQDVMNDSPLATTIFPSQSWYDSCDDDFEYDVYPEDYETEEEYNEALEDAKYMWRDTCEDGSAYGLDPWTFDSKKEYEEALASAKASRSEDTSEDNSEDTSGDYSLEFEIPGLEELGIITPDSFPTKRKYNAALELCGIRCGFIFYLESDLKNKVVERCEFILKNPDIPAANYLTHDGDFLFAQAVKEHFSLPFEIEDEDNSRTNDIDVVLNRAAYSDASFAVGIWMWCIKTFYPYRKYSNDESYIISYVLSHLENMPDVFIDALLRKIAENEALMHLLMTSCEESNYGVPFFTYRLLQKGDTDTAKRLVNTYLGGDIATEENIVEAISGLISYCSNKDVPETMILFKENILPIIAQLDQTKVKHSMNEWEERIAEYISQAQQKEAQREASFTKQQEKGTAAAQKAERKNIIDPVEETDKTTYIFCGVVFPHGRSSYYYRTDDETLSPGDKVVVPTGDDGKEAIGEIVSIEKHSRLTAPFPVDKVKVIKCKYDESEKLRGKAQT